MTGKHWILVVEDDIGWQRIIRKALEKHGYFVSLADNVEEAKIKLQEQRFSLATVDLNYKESQSTPEQEYGTDLLEYVEEKYPHLPCMILTASDDRDEESAVDLALKFKAVVKSYVKKNTQIRTTLPKKVEAILNRYDSSNENLFKRSQLIGNLEKEIFISYAWGGESERIVDQLDEAFRAKGVLIVRDKRNLGFKGRIKAFMEQIGCGRYVIVVVSDKYLKSPNCMFELVQIAKNKDFYRRIFPIVLDNANIYDPVERIEYIVHWENEIDKLNTAIKRVSAADLQGLREEIDLYTEIRHTISELIYIFKDMNTLTPDMHRASGFREIIEAIEMEIAER